MTKKITKRLTFITLVMWLFITNPLHLMINEMIGHFEEKNENKYLVLDDVDENKEVSKKYEGV